MSIKAAEKVLLMNDRISDLPDDILVCIISSLKLKEAGSTSVLSKRWRHLWTYVPNLNFDASEFLNKMRENCDDLSWGQTLKAEELKYFRWVDQVVNSHRTHTIDEFRVRFNFQMIQDIRFNVFDHWLRFAMEKRVKRLEFNVLALSTIFASTDLSLYTLPGLTPWSSLTSLELNRVDVTGEVLQKFLTDCPNLERLSVTHNASLVGLKIVGPLKLKYLKLWYCKHSLKMEHLEISAPNLTELSVSGRFATDLFSNVSELSRFMPQLEVFSLHNICPIAGIIPKVYPVAPRLKMLHIAFPVDSAEQLFCLIYMIKSCPVLHKLELKPFIYKDVRTTDETRAAEVFPHDKLKILEINGFTGCEGEMGFVVYLIKTFVSVEKITIKVDDFITDKRGKLRAMKKCKRLFALVKPETELEIIYPADGV